MKSYNGKVAAVTGAASGIGRALAAALARRGCHLALCDLDREGLARAAGEARAHGVRVTETVVDVAERDAMHAWAAEVVREHGRVNFIFNNAGVALGSTVEGMDYADLEWIIGINFWGVVHGTRAFLPHLRASGDGQVVNVSSVFGLFAQPGQGGYNASKFAVRGFTEALRQELELGGGPVSATCVHPGGIKTNIARAARFAPNMRAFVGSEAQAKAEFERFFITTPEKAAEVILEGVRRDKRRVLVGPDARVLDIVQRLLPGAYQGIVVRALRRQRRRRAAASSETVKSTAKDAKDAEDAKEG